MFPTRRRPWDAPKFATYHCAATVTAIAGVAAAGTAAYGAYSQGQQAKDAKAQIAANGQALYGSKVELPDYEDNVHIPHFNPGAGAEDYSHALPLLGSIANTVTMQGQRTRDRLSGGMSGENMRQAGVDINALLKGTVPQDQQDRVMRMVAERGAGAFSPTGQANQQAGTDFARSIGATSVDMMKLGLTYAPQWESMVDAFTYKPQQAFTDALSALRARTDYTFNEAQIQLEKDKRKYESEVNKARAEAMPNPQAVGAFRDNFTLTALGNQADVNTMNALLGAVKSAGAAYTGITGTTSTTGYNSAGYINPSQLGTVSTSYATPGYTPTFGTSPQGLYFTGYV